MGVQCPDCKTEIVVLRGWAPWCSECEWGVNPPTSSPESTTRRWWQRRLDAATAREHSELVSRATTSPPRHPLNRVAIAMALTIHAVTVALVAIAVGIWFAGVGPILEYIVSALAVLIVLAVLPVRRRRHRRRDDAQGWSRADAPSCFELIDLVAAGIGAPPPDRLAVNAGFNASVSRNKQLRVLTLGLPLWEVLDDDARLSLLAHEFGHEVNGDIRNGHLIHSASISLNKWLELLWPGTTPGMRHSMRGRRYLRRGDGDMVLANAVMAVIFAPMYAVALTIGMVFTVCMSRSSQRAEYRADRMAVRLAGSAATARLFDALLCSDLVLFSADVAVRGGASDVLPRLSAMLADVPESERERLRRRARIAGQRVDATHPPTSLRAAYAAAVPESDARLIVDPELLISATEELRRHTSAVERSLRTRVLA